MTNWTKEELDKRCKENADFGLFGKLYRNSITQR
jgi:hypothetical protein